MRAGNSHEESWPEHDLDAGEAEADYELIDLDADDADDADDGSAVVEETVELRPTRDDLNERLDKYVAAQLPDLSRGHIQRLIDDGQILVDGVPRRRTFKVTPGEIVTVHVPAPAEVALEPEPIPLEILYEDEDVLVLDKPAGMVVHPAPGHPRGTLVNALLYHAPEIAVAGSNRPGIVHRLDKDTSGLMVVAKSDRGRRTLVEQWNRHTVEKGYIALVRGIVEPDMATVDVPIGRDPKDRQRMAAVGNGRQALSHLRVRERFPEPGATLLDVDIETGRTHQIRVHLAFIGHPVVGDAIYNRSAGPLGGKQSIAPRQFLHAARLSFALPDDRRVAFESPLPVDLLETLSHLNATETGESWR
ncbi:MAG: rRNA synthase [Thermomicrobiales bacterium]|jgi:23S rRNA pseudouridine1911/1915/1917 synthase|nr:rRNA synthase [Thermomicrobiales bacterium]